jgi:hypothetical protein
VEVDQDRDAPEARSADDAGDETERQQGQVATSRNAQERTEDAAITPERHDGR